MITALCAFGAARWFDTRRFDYVASVNVDPWADVGANLPGR
jgi:hypothetical protein